MNRNNRAAKWINRFLERFGLRMTIVGKPVPWAQVSRLPSVETLIDVGVGRGTFNLYGYFPRSFLLLVEPLSESQPFIERVLADRPGCWRRVAAGSKEGSASFDLVVDDIGKSSLLKPSKGHKDTQWAAGTVQAITVEVQPLDQITQESGCQHPYGLKIDTEGYELEVLKGAKKVLSNTKFVIVETSVKERFEGGAMFDDVYMFMRTQGFRLDAVLSANPTDSKGTVKMIDLAFIRDDL